MTLCFTDRKSHALGQVGPGFPFPFPQTVSLLPTQVWGKYIQRLEDFPKPENLKLAVQCLNELVTDALQHVPDVLLYLSRLRNQSLFNFCAIPQVECFVSSFYPIPGGCVCGPRWAR